MVINENNSLINAFVKGMNSDTVYDMVDSQLYVFGKNIRITKNESIGGDLSNENHPSLHEGAITPVPFGETTNVDSTTEYGEFLASDSIGNISVVITTTNNILYVYRYVKTDNGFSGGLWWKGAHQKDIDELHVSTVMYQELEDVIKLYIATGIYPIIEIRVDNNVDYLGSNPDAHEPLDIDNYIHNRILPKHPIYIANKIDGSLKTQQLQYTYRFYNKFGTATLLAPLTNKILVISPNRSTEVGNAQDTTTSIGFLIQIKLEDEYKQYDRLLIYRLSYVVPGQNANVELIYDGDSKVEGNNSEYFLFNDVGNIPLQELTMEEFAAMSGMIVIPKIIEQNLQYMFASNITDDTIIQDAEITSTGNIEKCFLRVPITEGIEGAPVSINESFNPNDRNNDVYSYFKDRYINPDLPKQSYNDIFTSSLLRSLRRGETYKYGIVYYDKYGRHTNVLKLGSVEVGEIPSLPLTTIDHTTIKANVCGVKVIIPTPTRLNENNDRVVVDDIVGCLIVRRSSKQIYQNTLLQVAIAKPIAQDLYYTETSEDLIDDSVKKVSPYYPTGYLISDNLTTVHGYYWDSCKCPAYTRDNKLYLAMSNEFDFRRNDVISNLQSNVLTVKKVANYTLNNSISRGGIYDYEKYNQYARNSVNIRFGVDDQTILLDVHGMNQDPGKKISEYILFPLYFYNGPLNASKFDIKSVKDTKQALWYDGFSNIEINGGDIQPGGIKKYQSFTTSIEGDTYDNWVSSGIYDLRIGSYDDDLQNLGNDSDKIGKTVFISRTEWLLGDGPYSLTWRGRHGIHTGFIGPGPSCFLFTLKDDNNNLQNLGGNGFGAALCNIQHEAVKDNAEADEFVQYFGFGNYFPLKRVGDTYVVDRGNANEDNIVKVFDGDIYITPHELVTMYKTYDFISADTLPSIQVVNYVPMESKVNTFFDYGMNYLNTSSANLLSEPGSIDGVTTQERPIHQYNLIYSANDESNDVFTLVVEKPQDNNFKQRTYYSEPKTNGEYVDNFVIFKPAAYIDVDPKYGEMTNLLTDKNTLYYWQDTAFGKFSVNERSLINDTNGNTIMLGQAGILSRNDYISTKYGMRLYDFCATNAENGVYWVDINNKAIVGGAANEVVNIGERLNVQNIINAKINKYIPRVDYDLQNNELLCQCLSEKDDQLKEHLLQLIFNLKLNVATAIYNRDYVDIVSIKNHIYGYNRTEVENGKYVPSFIKYNYLLSSDSFLKPMAVSFVVNPAASTTKVFDSLVIVPAKRKRWEDNTMEPNYTDLVYSFETDINKTTNQVEKKTDREGNIVYNIPRFGFDPNYDYKTQWGNRLRGKWMKVDISTDNPDQYTTISHVITKFRQSYS